MRSKKSDRVELNSAENSQQKEKSQENFGLTALTSCLVDADGKSSSGAGRSRRKALGVSALIQFCTLTAMLIVPLFATGSRLIYRPTNFVPLPPYGGAPKQAPASTQRLRPPEIIHLTGDFLPVPPQIQVPNRPRTNNEGTEVADLNLGTNSSSNYDGIPGGDGTGDRVGLIPGPSAPQPPRPEVTPASTPKKPITVSQGVQLALLTHRVEPIYPNFARQAHREGTVELRAIISSEGAVRDVQILSGDPVLAHAAQDAVAQWRFRPTLLNGIAVEVITFVTVKFHIDQ